MSYFLLTYIAINFLVYRLLFYGLLHNFLLLLSLGLSRYFLGLIKRLHTYLRGSKFFSEIEMVEGPRYIGYAYYQGTYFILYHQDSTPLLKFCKHAKVRVYFEYQTWDFLGKHVFLFGWFCTIGPNLDRISVLQRQRDTAKLKSNKLFSLPLFPGL